MSSSKRMKNLKTGLLFTAPVLLGYAIFIVVPLVITFILSFTDYTIGGPMKFIGLTNFTDMFSGKDMFFYPAVKATIYYVFLSVPLMIAFSFMVAILLNQNIRGRGFFRGVFYLPVVIPLASAGIIWMWMLQPDFGVVNYLLDKAGSADLTVVGFRYDSYSNLDPLRFMELRQYNCYFSSRPSRHPCPSL